MGDNIFNDFQQSESLPQSTHTTHTPAGQFLLPGHSHQCMCAKKK